MKKWVLAGFLVIAAIFCAGWLDRPENYDCKTVRYKVTSRDTIWDICSDYVRQQNRYPNLNEFTWYVRKDNNLLGAKFIYPGDVIEIKLYTRKEMIKW